MSINIARFYKRERLELDCEVVTPMFLGNANQEAELRSAPFKGLLRYWWRIAEGVKYATPEKLLAAENKIFGSPDEEHGGKSQVTVAVKALSTMIPKTDAFINPGEIDHPECEKSKRKTNPLNYLAGMGLIHFKNGILHSYFAPGEKFQLQVCASQKTVDSVLSAMTLFGKFAAIGSRSRNGWGCYSCPVPEVETAFPLQPLSFAFERDYPHCLGKDHKGQLFWSTKMISGTWEKCMKELADIYVSIRAGNPAKNISRIDVKTGSPPDRHLLGYPVTNHPVTKQGWGKQGRHGSALRLLVRREESGFRGYILHLPHLFSTKMWPDGRQRQLEIWNQVHRSLDALCQRVTMEDGQ